MKGNSVSIKGNATRDQEISRTKSGKNIVKLGIAWNSSKRNQETGEYEDVPNYFDVEMWASDAQLNAMPTVRKGAPVAVIDGHLEYQSWQDSQGNNRSKVVIRCDDPIQGLMVGVARGAQNGAGNAYAAQQQNNMRTYQMAPQNQQQGLYDQDIPF